MYYQQLKENILAGFLDTKISQIVCSEDINNQKKRYLDLLDKAYEIFGDGDYHFISSPGRSEIGGNHTDHQHGHVLAASLNIDNLAIVKANGSEIVNYIDQDFGQSRVDLNDLKIHSEQYNSSVSLIRGIAARLKQLGYSIGGFDGLCQSQVLVGSGISSSACFEMLVVEVFNCLFNQNRIDPVQRALIGQYSENNYFGKASGLLDQMAISIGGFVAIDFKNPSDPIIEHFDFSFADYGYELLLINTKGDHADLTGEYQAIPQELKRVANCLGVEYLADTTEEEFYKNIAQIHLKVKNDRALLRTIHFFKEDQRAILQKQAIKEKNIDKLLTLMKESGRSSYMYLQNVSVSGSPNSQSLALALALADILLENKGAYRVHGGGFEGTIQCVVPVEKLTVFANLISQVYGQDSILKVRVRHFGTTTLI